MFPLTIPTAEAAVNPRDAVFINLRDTQWPAASEQLLEKAHRASMDGVTFLKKFRWYLNESDLIADP